MVHALDMLGREKNNQALRKTYRARYYKLRNALLEKIKLYSGDIDTPQLHEEELKKIRILVRKSIIRDRREALLKSALLTLVVLFFLGWFIFGVVL